MRTALLTLVLGVGMVGGAAAANPQRPNVVIILADDIGYGDFSCYGATRIRTPHCDRLASQGLRFTDAHSPAAVCTPTRFALLTGQYAFRHPPGSRILSGIAPLSIPTDRLTVAKLMQRAGYATGVVGKWHLGLGSGETDYNREIVPGPREVGFDESFIIPATGDRVPCVYVENQKVVGYDPADPIRISYGDPIGSDPTGASHPDQLTLKPSHGHNNTIVRGISRIGFMSGGQAARWKDEEMADTITRKAVGFIDRHADRPFFLYFATHDIHVPRVPHPRFRGSSQCGVRGDAVQEFDASVGEVLAALERHKIAENTLVIVTSDNGGVIDDGYQDRAVADLNGHLCNGALRGYKGSLYEGGTRVPFLVRWPGRVPAGTATNALIAHVDVLATLAAITQQPLAASDAPDSFNQWPSLQSARPDKPVRDHLMLQAGYVNGLCLRQGDWKYIPAGRRGGKAAPAGPELFNLSDDLGETRNLADKQPDRVRELEALFQRVQKASRTRPE